MKKCTKCNVVKNRNEFYRGGGWCKACHIKNAKEYIATHREEVASYQAEYQKSHRQKCREYSKLYARKHPEQNAAYRKLHSEEIKAYKRTRTKVTAEQNRAYRQAHRPKMNALYAKRRASKKQRTPKWISPKEIEPFYAEAERLTQETGIRYSVDHIIPLQGKLVSGLHVPWNLQVIPLIDNIKKGNRFRLK